MIEKTNIKKNDTKYLSLSRVYRGGGWFNGPNGLRSAWLNVITPSSRSGSIGFRLVLQTKDKK
jgi:formylglycine-generating enzyme required for sulfatase activity